eukprot:g374.t1
MDSPLRRLAWQNSSSCQECKASFQFVFRHRHHCRDCGKSVCKECLSIVQKPEKDTRLCKSCVSDRFQEATFASNSKERAREEKVDKTTATKESSVARRKRDIAPISRADGFFSIPFLSKERFVADESKRQALLAHAISMRKKQHRPDHGNPFTVATDGSSLNLRLKGYSENGRKGPSLPAAYTLVGSKFVRSTSGKKLTNVSESDLFASIVREWIDLMERDSGLSDDLVRDIIEKELREVDSSVVQSSTCEAKHISSKDADGLGKAEAFAKSQQLKRLKEDEVGRKMFEKTASKHVTRRSLPRFLVWNVTFPSIAPDSGFFGGLFGTAVASGDYGQNLIMLFRLTESASRSYEEWVAVSKAQNVGSDKNTRKDQKEKGLGALKLFARFVQAVVSRDNDAEGESKADLDRTGKSARILDPVLGRFKLIAKVTNDVLANAGFGWLSGYNGRPRILRDTVECRYRASLRESSDKLIRSLDDLLRPATSSSSSPMKRRVVDVFEVETDIMQWTRPIGLPLRVLWAAGRFAKSTVTTLAFTIESQSECELPERVVACADVVGLEFRKNAIDESDFVSSVRNRSVGASSRKADTGRSSNSSNGSISSSSRTVSSNCKSSILEGDSNISSAACADIASMSSTTKSDHSTSSVSDTSIPTARRTRRRRHSQAFRDKSVKMSTRITRTKWFKSLCRSIFEDVDVDDSGSIDPTEVYLGVLLLYTKIIPYVTIATPPSRERVMELFKECDEDRSGYLDHEEFEQMATILCWNLTHRMAKQMAFYFAFGPLVALTIVSLLDSYFERWHFFPEWIVDTAWFGTVEWVIDGLVDIRQPVITSIAAAFLCPLVLAYLMDGR